MKTYEQMNPDEKVEYNTRNEKEGSFKIETPEEFGELQPFKLTCKSCQNVLFTGQNELGDGSILLDYQTMVFKAYCNKCMDTTLMGRFEKDFSSLEIQIGTYKELKDKIYGYRIACLSCKRRLLLLYVQDDLPKLKVNIQNKMFKAFCLRCTQLISGDRNEI